MERVAAEQTHLPGDRPLEQGHGPQQHGLAAARGTDDAENFTTVHSQIHVFMDHTGTEAVVDALQFDDRSAHHRSSRLNRMENRASTTITRKMLWTTLRVVA